VVPPESPSHSDDILNSVAATSTDDVWTVGQTFDSSAGGWRGLIEHFCPTP
jgi:hypothetical protein